jgi:hypothetical protein
MLHCRLLQLWIQIRWDGCIPDGIRVRSRIFRVIVDLRTGVVVHSWTVTGGNRNRWMFPISSLCGPGEGVLFRGDC